MSILGNRVLRKEDPRFLRGEGTYVENLPLEGAHGDVRPVAVRARPHQRDRRLGRGGAPEHRGLTADDVDDVSIGPPPIPVIEQRLRRPLVAKDVVRFVGDIVAIVLSDDRASGMDAAELVAVDYEPLPGPPRPGGGREGRAAALPGRRHEHRGPRQAAWTTTRRCSRTATSS